jgi:DNA-binding NarL/FixJ family response regulator
LRLRKILPTVKIIFLTQHADPAYVQEAIRAGASGYVLKHSAGSELLTAIREVALGRAYISPRVARAVFDLPGKGTPLTTRQREVLQLVAEGHSNKEIAAVLNISTKTLEYHKSTLMKRQASVPAELTVRYPPRQWMLPNPSAGRYTECSVRETGQVGSRLYLRVHQRRSAAR